MPEFEVFLGEVAITPYETPGTPGVRRHGPPLRQGYRHDHPGQPRHDHRRQRPEGRLLQDRDHRRLLPDLDPGQAARHDQLLLRREGRRADQDQARPRHPRRPARAGPRELRPLRQQPLPRGLLRLQARATSAFIPAKLQQQRAASRRRPPSRNLRRPTTSRPSSRSITDQVMHAMNGAGGSNGDASVVKGRTFASGISGGA